jgi:ribosome-binding ATPase
MGFRTGIVGLPNVGKSTLFNALTRTAAAQAANFPFCTIEPNVGEVAVPDPRLARLAEIGKSAKVIPARMTFVDIAGLVRGASKGEGLGNQFLANIRECDAIAQVLRCFEDDDITHVEGRVDPVADAETIETELMLADLESVERRQAGLVRRLKGADKEAAEQAALLERAKAALEGGRPARTVEIAAEERRAWNMIQLLTAKPVLYVCNVEEASAASGNALSARVAEMARAQGAGCVVISARIEEEIAQLADAERAEFLEAMGLDEPGLDRLIREGYRLLGLQTYFTVGPKEARAWTIPGGHPHRFRARLHPGRDDRLRGLRQPRRGGGGQGGRKDALGGEGVPGGGRGRDALSLQRLRPAGPLRQASARGRHIKRLI